MSTWGFIVQHYHTARLYDSSSVVNISKIHSVASSFLNVKKLQENNKHQKALIQTYVPLESTYFVSTAIQIHLLELSSARCKWCSDRQASMPCKVNLTGNLRKKRIPFTFIPCCICIKHLPFSCFEENVSKNAH